MLAYINFDKKKSHKKMFSVILTTQMKWTAPFIALLPFSIYAPVFGTAIHDFDLELSWACCVTTQRMVYDQYRT